MAFDPLATSTDLENRNITVPDALDEATILASASWAVRDAAGCPISEADSTVDLTAVDDLCSIDLPGGPVTSVASVAVEGVAVAASTLVNGCWSDGWRKSGNTVLLKGQWAELPATVTVTYTHGFAAVPADIIDLVCAMVAMACNAGADVNAYGSQAQSAKVRLGDYAETFQRPPGTESPSPVAVPDAVRERLRARFGTSAVTLRMR